MQRNQKRRQHRRPFCLPRTSTARWKGSASSLVPTAVPWCAKGACAARARQGVEGLGVRGGWWLVVQVQPAGL